LECTDTVVGANLFFADQPCKSQGRVAFPRIPAFFNVTAVCMIGEKLGDAILIGVSGGVGFIWRRRSGTQRAKEL